MWQLPYQPVSGIIRIWGNFVDGTLKLREDDQRMSDGEREVERWRV